MWEYEGVEDCERRVFCARAVWVSRNQVSDLKSVGNEASYDTFSENVPKTRLFHSKNGCNSSRSQPILNLKLDLESSRL